MPPRRERSTAIVLEETLSWRAPVIAPERITTMFAFTFGNRMLPNGNREPGPVNQALADVVAASCTSAPGRGSSRNGRLQRRWRDAFPTRW